MSKSSSGRRLRRVIPAAACLLLPAASALADADAPQIAQAAPPPPRGQIEEIVVTAEHRTENIREVPMSITALTGDQMEQQGLKNVADIAR